MQLPVPQQTQGQRRSRSRAVDSGGGGSGVVYPIDLWFLVGSYVAAEDVSTFACICRDTHIVVHSARFWLSLYHRSAYRLLCDHPYGAALSVRYILSVCPSHASNFLKREKP